MLIGHCSFGTPDAALLVSLLPDIVLVRDRPRLATLIQLIGEETRERRAARGLVLERLLEVLLIEALRSATETSSAPGLSRGLADERLAVALRAIHARPEHPWSVAELASVAAMSRSAFFARFNRIVGQPPMAYLLPGGWRWQSSYCRIERAESSRLRYAWAMGRQAASALRLPAMSACPRPATHASKPRAKPKMKKARSYAGLKGMHRRRAPEAKSFPFDRRRRLTADVIHHAGDTVHFVDDAVGDAAEEVVRQVRPVGGHKVDGFLPHAGKQPSRTCGHRPSRRRNEPAGTR
nr:AraC family transcriptional regulator [Raoultella sp. NCTC 9187]